MPGSTRRKIHSYIVYNGQNVGPFVDEELSRFLEDGKLKPENLIWREGFKAPIRVDSVPGLCFQENLPAAPSNPFQNSRQIEPAESRKPDGLRRQEEASGALSGIFEFISSAFRFLFFGGLIISIIYGILSKLSDNSSVPSVSPAISETFQASAPQRAAKTLVESMLKLDPQATRYESFNIIQKKVTPEGTKYLISVTVFYRNRFNAPMQGDFCTTFTLNEQTEQFRYNPKYGLQDCHNPPSQDLVHTLQSLNGW